MVLHESEGVTSPLGTMLTIGIVILMAIGLTFMVRIFMDRGEDPQSLATFNTNEVDDTIRVLHHEAGVTRGDFEIRLSVDGDFDVKPPTPGPHAFPADEFVMLGGAPGGPPNEALSVGTVFHFCAASGTTENVKVDIRHSGSNSVIWRGDFLTLGACP